MWSSLLPYKLTLRTYFFTTFDRWELYSTNLITIETYCEVRINKTKMCCQYECLSKDFLIPEYNSLWCLEISRAQNWVRVYDPYLCSHLRVSFLAFPSLQSYPVLTCLQTVLHCAVVCRWNHIIKSIRLQLYQGLKINRRPPRPQPLMPLS